MHGSGIGPALGNALHPSTGRGKLVRVDGKDDLATDSAACDQTCRLHHAQVLCDGLSRDGSLACQCGRRARAMHTKFFQNVTPSGVGQRVENLIDGHRVCWDCLSYSAEL